VSAASLWRRAVAEAVGTGLLVTVVVGWGIPASALSRDVGLQLLENAFATALSLAVLILMAGQAADSIVTAHTDTTGACT
jgi:glycerol uptake facilitator-like aquaporin